MNREILFRGKRVDNGEWVYGYYWFDRWVKGTPAYIIDDDAYLVDPETVGQYTGLTDKNGVKIFVGDIVRHDSGTLHEVVFEHRNGCAYFGWVRNEFETWHFDSGFLRQLEVIGNIHDNKSLLNNQDKAGMKKGDESSGEADILE